MRSSGAKSKKGMILILILYSDSDSDSELLGYDSDSVSCPSFLPSSLSMFYLQLFHTVEVLVQVNCR